MGETIMPTQNTQTPQAQTQTGGHTQAQQVRPQVPQTTPQDMAQAPQKPTDTTTGDTYVTEKNLAQILKKLNQSLGDEALKEIIDQQKEALEQLNKEFAEQLKEKNDKIAELEKQINDLLLNQPLNPN
ncbi:hypothetical protein LS80_011170, partial [Helicobacter trogontum]